MADLDFKHSVSQIPAGPEIPEIKRSVSAEVTPAPDYQSAVSNYAQNTNWMSAVGSEVASKASSAIATKLGGEMGKNPTGDLGMPITDFDKTLQQSYHTQAQATLGLQASTLITDSNIKMAQLPRITPDVIASTNKQLTMGLQGIFKNAPSAVRTNLEYQYGIQQLAQASALTQRMVREQREDRVDTFKTANKTSSENAYTAAYNGLDLDKDGNSKAALQEIENQKAANIPALAQNDIKQLTANVSVDTVRQAALSGKYTRLAVEAEKKGKLDQFLSDLDKNPPPDINNADHKPVFNNVINRVSQNKSLRAGEENLVTQQMDNDIAKNPGAITGTQWALYESKVSPLKAEQTKFRLIQALKSDQANGVAVNNLIANFGNPTVQANADAKIKNAAFNKVVQNLMTNHPEMTQDQAEVQAAMSAGGLIPVYTQTLKNKLWSGDPAQMDSGAEQIFELKSLHAGHALMGLDDKDEALYMQYEAQRNPADPTTGARIVAENHENQDPAIKKIVDEKWSNLVFQNTKIANADVDSWILKKFDFAASGSWNPFSSVKSFDSPFMATTYAADIMNKFHTNYMNTRGNELLATQMTKQYVDTNYGQTEVNGGKVWTNHPIEKTLGFQSSDGVPAIHKDIIRQLEVPMANLKQAYDNKASNDYWTIEAPKSSGDPIKMIRHNRAELGTTTESYNLMLIGNDFDKWDVNIQSNNVRNGNSIVSMRNLFLEDPKLGIMNYSPDRQWIHDEYNGKHKDQNSEGSGTPYVNSGGPISNTLSSIGNAIIPEAQGAPASQQEPQFNPKEFSFLKEKEGLRLKAYQDSGGVWTIGYGHTGNVKQGDTVTHEQADNLFANDLKPNLKYINTHSKTSLNNNQVQALLSFGHEEGIGTLGKMIKFINSGASDQEIKDKFMKYDVAKNKSGDRVHMDSIKRRRSSEVNLYFKK